MRQSVFISVANLEYRELRAKVRNLLSGKLDVIVEPDFPASTANSVERLDQFLQPSNLVVHLVGKEPGSKPPSAHVDQFLEANPEFISRIQTYSTNRDQQLNPHSWTFPQWEAWLAIYRGIDLLVFDESSIDSSSEQAAHLELLKNFVGWVHRLKPEASCDGQISVAVQGHFELGLRQKQLREIRNRIEKANSRFKSTVTGELINRTSIPRKETKDILAALAVSDKRGVLVVANAGSGKSCILAQVQEALNAQGAMILSLQLDTLPESPTALRIGEVLGLSTSPVEAMRNVAANAPCVLIVDQLDAVSTVSGRKTASWDGFDEMCREAGDFPNVKIVVACRSFDLREDDRLRRLDSKDSAFVKVDVLPLDDSELRDALNNAGLNSFDPDTKQAEILRLPLHLLLFLKGDPNKLFSRVGDLFDRFWKRKQRDLFKSLGNDHGWLDVIEKLSLYMSEHQSLVAPADLIDRWEATTEQMVSLHVLVTVDSQLRFFHEAFFDYAFARCFASTGQTLLDYLTQPGEQQLLFRRAQVRQVLAYRREHRRKEYLQDLSDLLTSSSVRFHLQKMVVISLREIPAPQVDEWRIIEPYLFDNDLSGSIQNALATLGWFDLLLKNGMIHHWLNSGDERFARLGWWIISLPAMLDQRSDEIAQELELLVEDIERLKPRFQELLSWGKIHKSARMWQLFEALFETCFFGDEPTARRDIWSVLDDVAEQAPKLVIDFVKRLFVRSVLPVVSDPKWELDSVFKARDGSRLVSRSAIKEPEYFLKQMLPLVVDAIVASQFQQLDKWKSRYWPYLTNAVFPLDISDEINIEVWRQLQVLAQKSPARWRELMSPFAELPHDVVTYLFLESFSANPEEFAPDCIAYFLAYPQRLYVGYDSHTWSSSKDRGCGQSAIARRAIVACSEYWSESQLQTLEESIIGECDEYEKLTPHLRGMDEFLLLTAIDESKRSKRVATRIWELEPKFKLLPTYIPEPDAELISATGSPISVDRLEKLTDKQWISAMKKYCKRHNSGDGGPVELSRALGQLAMKDRVRFAKLALKMPDQIVPEYFSAILDAMTGQGQNLNSQDQEVNQEIIKELPIELFKSVIERLHKLPSRPCGMAICDCVRALTQRELPEVLLNTVAWYAKHDPNPEKDFWLGGENGRVGYGGDPHLEGINTVRGRAAWCISSLLFEDDSRAPMLQQSIQDLSQDSSVAVRSVAIESLMALLNTNRDLAVQLFLKCTENGPPQLWATPPFSRFMRYAIPSHLSRLEELIQNSLACEVESAVENMALEIVFASLGDNMKTILVEEVCSGSDVMRRKACHVYAVNLGNEKVASQATECIRQFFNDPQASIREMIGIGLRNLNGEWLLAHELWLTELIASPAFEENADDILHSLDESRAKLPDVIELIAGRLLELHENGNPDLHRAIRQAYNSLSGLLVRQYSQTQSTTTRLRLLDYIDQFLRLGIWGMNEELEKLDRS